MSNSPLDPNRLWHELEEAAEERAAAVEVAHRLERMGEILLAKLQVQAKNDGNPIGICKEVARAQPEWQTHIEGETVAVARRDRARAKYENLKILFEARRTIEASARALAR